MAAEPGLSEAVRPHDEPRLAAAGADQGQPGRQGVGHRDGTHESTQGVSWVGTTTRKVGSVFSCMAEGGGCGGSAGGGKVGWEAHTKGWAWA